MDYIEDCNDERHKSFCIYCGCAQSSVPVSRDHVPTKGFLLEPYPRNLPTVTVCRACNGGYSLDEEFLIAFLGAVLSGTTDPAAQKLPAASRILGRNENLKSLIDGARQECPPRGDEKQLIWMPDSERVRRVIIKNSRGHAFYEFGEPMLTEPVSVSAVPLQVLSDGQRTAFEHVDAGPGWPEVGSRMMTRLMGGQDLKDGWVVVQEGVYRYAVFQDDGIVVRTILHEYLATEVLWE